MKLVLIEDTALTVARVLVVSKSYIESDPTVACGVLEFVEASQKPKDPLVPFVAACLAAIET